MKEIKNLTIYRDKGFTAKELLDNGVVYKDCTFLIDIKAEYCLRYTTIKCNSIINTYIQNCKFECGVNIIHNKDNSTIGHSIGIFNKDKLNYNIYAPVYYLTKFPLPKELDK